jgi:hypothetical protein
MPTALPLVAAEGEQVGADLRTGRPDAPNSTQVITIQSFCYKRSQRSPPVDGNVVEFRAQTKQNLRTSNQNLCIENLYEILFIYVSSSGLWPTANQFVI